MKDLKYLFGYLPIIITFFGFSIGGIWTFSGMLLAFALLPLIEFLTPGTTKNRTDIATFSVWKNRFFDILLYLNIPLMYGLLYYFCQILFTETLATYEIIGMISSMGVVLGSAGINVAHELGHRETKYEQFFSKVLLLPELYLHFFIEHNLGHHKNIATDEDPASSKLNETLYAFYVRSVFGGYRSAWTIENNRLVKMGKPALSTHNQMIWFQVIQMAYLAIVYFTFGGFVLFAAIIAGVLGFLQLETVNYIEHYGLRRKKLPSGRYENVSQIHSWNSNHDMGRIVLYELTRHSDHHFKSTRKYQTLRHFDESPQLPYGYPASMILSLFPPLWFRIMNPRVEQFMKAVKS